ncbi:hypothetical protein PIB30_077755, partial [Stylosanthes scabra]|nr:hypothetical protein [Stylosanthes scabra]
ESAYTAIRREVARLQILKPTIDSGGDTSQGKIGIRVAAKNKANRDGQGCSRLETTIRRSSPRDKEDKSYLYCTDCGIKKHTRISKGAVTIGIPEVTSNGGGEARREEENRDGKAVAVRSKTAPEASGELIDVKGGGSIPFSGKLKLKHCLYVPAYSSKLLSDILTKEIIGHGTRVMSCLLMERLPVNFGYGIGISDILHLGISSFYFLVFLQVTLNLSNVRLVFEQKIIEFPFSNQH